MELIGVLLMAYGSPDSLDDLESYLLDVRGGRALSPHALAEIRERYAQIGGRSPLLDLTRRQASALEEELNRLHGGPGLRFKSYIGMRHWQPRIQAAVEKASADGASKLVGLVMAPHQSRMSTGAYYQRLESALAGVSPAPGLVRIESWHENPGLIDALTEHLCRSLERFDRPPYILFTAHSLPARLKEQGDPYDAQVHRTAELVAAQAGLEAGRWEFSYQSAGMSPEPWLGPSIDETIDRLARSGEKDLLVCPVGFVCDHIEILYDLDIAAKDQAAKLGARLERTASLNDSPTFIRGLAGLVWDHVYPLLRP